MSASILVRAGCAQLQRAACRPDRAGRRPERSPARALPSAGRRSEPLPPPTSLICSAPRGPFPRGRVTEDPEEAARICEELGGRCVVKAQIHAGGRGKGGGVKLAKSPEEAREAAGRILGMQLVTHQTGPEGQLVRKVLIEEAADIAKELYVSITLDRAQGKPVIMASTEGGMDIEEVAEHSPEKIFRIAVDPQLGILPFQARSIVRSLGLKGQTASKGAKLISGLVTAYLATDASLAEIN